MAAKVESSNLFCPSQFSDKVFSRFPKKLFSLYAKFITVTPMLITVKIRNPKYVRRNYEFDSLEKLYNMLALIRSVGKHNLSSYIFVLAKDGRLNLSKYGFSIDAKLDCPDYTLANKLAKDVGLIVGWERFKPDKEKTLAFAKAFDSAKSRE